MAGFPPNVEGRELWLPTEGFPEEMYRFALRPAAKLESEFGCELTSSMEELAHRLAYAILNDNHHCSPEPAPVFAPLSQARSLRSSEGYLRLGQSAFEVGASSWKQVHPSMTKPVFGPTQILLKPCHNQAPMVSRTRSQGRGLPFRVVGSGASGFIRESGGTGVFLPRVVYTDACTRRKPNMKPIEDPSLRNVGVGRGFGRGGGVNSITIHSSRRHHLPSEIALPSEWAY